MGRRVGLFALVLLLGIQLAPVERSNPPVSETIPAEPAVAAILQRACFDCHSHETRWPWYARVAPVSWLVAHDVHEAREHFDMSTWDAYGPKKRRKLLDELIEEVHEGEMPLWYYVLLHPEAELSQDDLDQIDEWVGRLLAAEGG